MQVVAMVKRHKWWIIGALVVAVILCRMGYVNWCKRKGATVTGSQRTLGAPQIDQGGGEGTSSDVTHSPGVPGGGGSAL